MHLSWCKIGDINIHDQEIFYLHFISDDGVTDCTLFYSGLLDEYPQLYLVQ